MIKTKVHDHIISINTPNTNIKFIDKEEMKKTFLMQVI